MPEAQSILNAKSAAPYSTEQVQHSLARIILGWAFGSGFFAITGGAVFASFVKNYLKAPDIPYGLIMAAGPAASVFLFAGSHAVEKSGRAKPNFMVFVTLHRLMWLAMAAMALFGGDRPVEWLGYLAALVVFVAMAFTNYGGAGWLVWMSDIVPKRSAGAFWGMRMTVGLLSMVLVSSVTSWIIDHNKTNPHAYFWILLVAVALGVADILCFISVPEVPRTTHESTPTFWQTFSTPWRNPLFRGFALYCSLAWMGYIMIGTFIWPFCFDPVSQNGLGLSLIATNLMIVVLPQLTMAVFAPMWGSAIDRFGPKPVLGLGSIMAAAMPIGWLFIYNSPGVDVDVAGYTLHVNRLWLIPLLQIVGAFSWPAIEQGILYVQMNRFPEKMRSSYISAFQVVLGLSMMVANWLAGLFATFWLHYKDSVPIFPKWFSHYHPVFLTAIMIRIFAYVFIYRRLDLGGKAPVGEVARSVISETKKSVPRLAGKARKRGK